VLLATIDATADDKLTRFAIRLALSGHLSIPRENEPDFLTEAEAVFAPKNLKAVKSKGERSTKPKPTAPKASTGKDTEGKQAA